jgi:hypothetical protein
MTLVVIRVVYADGIPVSVTAPQKFSGETARIEASSYVRRLLNAGLRERNKSHRVEYHVLPVGEPESMPAKLRGTPIPMTTIASIQNRVTVPEIRLSLKR